MWIGWRACCGEKSCDGVTRRELGGGEGGALVGDKAPSLSSLDNDDGGVGGRPKAKKKYFKLKLFKNS